jgi:hypothetical protein
MSAAADWAKGCAGNDVGPIFRLRDAGRHHPGLRVMGRRLVQPGIQLLAGPGIRLGLARLGLDSDGVVEILEMATRLATHIIKTGADTVAAAFGEGVANAAEATSDGGAVLWADACQQRAGQRQPGEGGAADVAAGAAAATG